MRKPFVILFKNYLELTNNITEMTIIQRDLSHNNLYN